MCMAIQVLIANGSVKNRDDILLGLSRINETIFQLKNTLGVLELLTRFVVTCFSQNLSLQISLEYSKRLPDLFDICTN